jgi:putative ATPase
MPRITRSKSAVLAPISRPSPLSWRPQSPADLVGPARLVGERLFAKVTRLKTQGGGPLKLLLYGPPGVGKTSLAELLARQLVANRWDLEDVNGKTVNVEVVKQWMDRLAYGSLWGDWTVKLINEFDRCSRDAQDLLLTYLDQLPPGKAVIGTSNLDLGALTDRVQTRFQAIKIEGPTTEELASFLGQRFDTPPDVANMVAVGSGGNVRAALADLETWFDANDQ